MVISLRTRDADMLARPAFADTTSRRKIDDEKLDHKVENTYRSCCFWAKACELNKAVPAPLDGKTMFSPFVLGTLEKSNENVADLADVREFDQA
jgi:benzoyl-CoA reductase subunit B